MLIEQIYTGCLAQGAYYIECNGEAAVIDPLRETDPYIRKAVLRGAKIKYVLETHFHADFVSGHLDLANKTNAPIVYGPNAKPNFEFYGAKDGEILPLGKCEIKVLHTPGHTMESTCYLLLDEEGNEKALFSGDTLFIGDVGRPDLAQKLDSDLTQDKLAGHLFESLRNKIMTLSNEIIVYPAHGAGSACGKNMSRETSDTLGHQKKTNYALNPNLSKEEFIKQVTDGLTAPPAYFPLNVMMNINGYESLETVMERGLNAFSPDEMEQAVNETGALVLDVRKPEEFAKGFIPNSINIGLEGSFAPWVGAMIPDIKQNIIFVAEPGTEKEVITRLSRVGYDQVLGYLKGGISSWINSGKEIDNIPSISADEFAEVVENNKDTHILDVRKETEFEPSHIQTAKNIPLDYINDQMHDLRKDENYFVHCAGGYRSMIFASILKSRGFENVTNITGGYKSIKESGKFNLQEK